MSTKDPTIEPRPTPPSKTPENPTPEKASTGPGPAPAPAPARRKPIPPEVRKEIVRLHEFYGSRQIARRVDLSRKRVRHVLREEGCLTPLKARSSPKLTPYLHQIEEKVLKGLAVTRILREIREIGYDGGRTILARKVREIRAQHALVNRNKKVKRRFETEQGREIQIDWSPYWIVIAGHRIQIHILGALLCHCRKLFVGFYRDERQHTLLEGLADAFAYFGGCTIDLVLDNMATAILGRIGPDRKPLWHPVFEQFVGHYGMNAIPCAVMDPDRKGKKEKSFRLVKDDFLKGSEFDSWEHLQREGNRWLDGTPAVANQRIHGTTGERPNEAFRVERDFLIRLPQERFPIYENSIRCVDNDATLSVLDRKYSVPAFLANRSVQVRLFAHHFEVLDPNGRVAFSRTYAGPEEKRKLIIDTTHYACLPRRPRGGDGGSPGRLDEAFVRRFPDLAPLVDGLKVRMKTLAPVHIRKLLRLAERFGQAAFLDAARRAQEFRRFDANAIARILEDEHPDSAEEPTAPLTGNGAVAIGEVDQGSLDGYGHLDGDPASDPTAGPAQDADTNTDDPDNPDDSDDDADEEDPDDDADEEDPHGS